MCHGPGLGRRGFGGQVTTFTGSISDNALTATHLPGQFTGTYTIGGCASGDEGNIPGVKVPSLTGNWGGTLTTGTGDDINVEVGLTQGTATSEGNFGLTGTVTFSDLCFKSGKIASGAFPSGSYIMGRAVCREIETDNGVIVFLGTAEGDGLVRGNYTVVGGTCELTGTGYLSPWEY